MENVYMQKCHGCEEEFMIQYLERGGYRYIGEACECEDSFSPSDIGAPSISEWIDSKS